VYDITDVDSFARVKNWVRELRKIVGDDISICIAGNKKDLQKNAHVTEAEAEEYARSVGAQHIRTSAKNNDGVNEVFLALVQSASFMLGARVLCGDPGSFAVV
jgi:Ras-related protein Rab-21